MKEYYAEGGGRPVFSEDIENLQELALSMTSMFEGAGDFIICGCEVRPNMLTAGYVYLNGKIRKVEQTTLAGGKFCIIENNSVESARYKSGAMKDSRKCYLAQVVTPEVGQPYPHKIVVTSAAKRLADVLKAKTFGDSQRLDIDTVNLMGGMLFGGDAFVVRDEDDNIIITNPSGANVAIKLCVNAAGPHLGVMVGQYINGQFTQTRNQIDLNVIGLWCNQLWVGGKQQMFDSQDLNYAPNDNGDDNEYSLTVAGGGSTASICGNYDCYDVGATSRFGTWYQMLRNSDIIPPNLLPKHDMVVEVSAFDPSKMIAEDEDGVRYLVRAFVKVTTGGDMSIMFVGSNGYDGGSDNRVFSELGADRLSLSIAISYPIDI